MITEKTLTSQIRMFANEGGSYETDPYDAICTVTYLSADTVYICGFNGKVSRKMYRAFIIHIYNNGIRTIFAERVGKHKLPLAKPVNEFLSKLDVIEAYTKLARLTIN